jgi:hypothetical protein
MVDVTGNAERTADVIAEIKGLAHCIYAASSASVMVQRSRRVARLMDKQDMSCIN